MGIFKETLPKFLRTQIGIRQHILSVGNNGNQHRLGQSKFGDINIESGAFFTNTLNKHCTIRMSSMVDITSTELLNLDLKIGNVQLEKDLVLAGLAQSYMLQGGTLLMPKGARTPAMRRGFPGKGRPLGGAYGDPLARADGSVDSYGESYGIVPMPGIQSANIRTKSAYGSLREAKIEFVCHNLRQLAVMEILYMRPGFPVLLEWGWTPYVSNSGKIQGRFPYISDLDQFWGRKGKRILVQSEITDLITTGKKNTGGNYDAVLGLVKNFSYTARPDGGFNCTTELMAAGEVISSLKGLNAKVTGQEVNVFAIMPAILDFLQKSHDFVYNFNQDGSGVRDSDIKRREYPGKDGLYDTEDDKDVINKNFNRSPAYWQPPEYYGTSTIELWKDRRVTSNISRADVEKDFKENILEGGQKYSLQGGVLNEDYRMHFKNGRSNWNYVWAGLGGSIGLMYGGWPGASLAYNYIANQDNGVSEGYVRLDALLYFINKSCINPTPRQPNEKLTCYQTIKYNSQGKDRSGKNKNRFYSPCLLNEYNHKALSLLSSAPNGETVSKFLDVSCDPYVCLMPKQYPDVIDSKGKDFVKPIQNFYGFRYADFKPEGQFHKDFDGTDINEAENSIGHIMLNLEYLLDVHDELFGSEDYSLGNYVKKVLEGINDACAGSHKLMLVTDNENPQITNIVDMNHPPQEDYNDIFKFNVISNDSAVRQFSFNSAVPSGMAATIAVAAGDPDNVDSLDAVTFAALNRGISNRLYRNKPPSAKGPTTDEIEKSRNKLFSSLQEMYDLVHQIGDYNMKVASGQFFNKGNDAFKSKVSTTKTQMSRLHELIDTIGMKDKDGFVVNNPPSSTPIPIKIDIVLDGISGMVIGQLFRINESRLPIQYRDKKVIFIVVSEDQSIDEGGNWTTKLSGQMQLFPNQMETKSWDGWVIPLSDSSQQLNEKYEVDNSGFDQTNGGPAPKMCRNTPDTALYGLEGAYAKGEMAAEYWSITLVGNVYPNTLGLPLGEGSKENVEYICGLSNVSARDGLAINSGDANMFEDQQNQYEQDIAENSDLSCEEAWEHYETEHAKAFVQEIIDLGESFGFRALTSDEDVLSSIKEYTAYNNGNQEINVELVGTLKRVVQAADESGVPIVLKVGFEEYLKKLIDDDSFEEAMTYFPDVLDEKGTYVPDYNYGVPPVVPSTPMPEGGSILDVLESGYNWCEKNKRRYSNTVDDSEYEDDIIT